MTPWGKLGRSRHCFRVDQLSIVGVRVAAALERLQKLGVPRCERFSSVGEQFEGVRRTGLTCMVVKKGLKCDALDAS